MQARQGGVIAMLAETMRPTIKHFAALDSDVSGSSRGGTGKGVTAAAAMAVVGMRGVAGPTVLCAP